MVPSLEILITQKTHFPIEVKKESLINLKLVAMIWFQKLGTCVFGLSTLALTAYGFTLVRPCVRTSHHIWRSAHQTLMILHKATS